MKKIIVPTDFSDNALKATIYAAELAKKSGAAVLLTHIVEPVTDSIRQPHALHGRLEEEIVHNRKKELAEIQQSFAQAYPDITTEIELAKGTIITSLLDVANRKEADIIVMGTKGATGLKEVFLGSVATGIIGKTKIPVLAIPGDYEVEEPDAILFATNHFEENKTLLIRIADIAKLFSTVVHVAVFVDTDTAEATDYIDNQKQLGHYMNFLKIAFPDVSFKGELLAGKEFEETIEKYDSENAVDIIAMITYPKSFWEKFLKKSITRRMAFHSKIPVLAIPAK